MSSQTWKGPAVAFATVVVMATVTHHAQAADASASASEAEAAFQKGADLMEKGQFKEAIPLLKRAEQAFPQAASVLWNLGIASAEVGDHSGALGYWQKFRKARPDDWKAIAKLIQGYQALGDVASRDREIKALYDLRAKSKTADLQSADKFCREQFSVAGQKILVFEYFDPAGERRLYYRFSLTDAKSGAETSFISLGSYDSTTDIARELGEIGRNARAYHVDRYEKGVHTTYAHFDDKPSYETVRQIVVDVVQGKRRPVSGSSSPPKGKPSGQ